jgi:hypothetical protein
VRTGAEVTGIREASQRVGVTYQTADGPRQAAAELVVGADGIHSTVRRLLWPEAPPPVFQRITCWRGVTEPGSVWPVDGFQTWGRGQRVGTHPLPNRRVYWFLTIRQDRPGVRYDGGPDDVSALCAACHELSQSGAPLVVEQIIRPTGLLDPKITLKPLKNQIDETIELCRQRVEKQERVLVTTLTKRTAEDLSDYLRDVGLKVRYLHSDIDTIERVEILRGLRAAGPASGRRPRSRPRSRCPAAGSGCGGRLPTRPRPAPPQPRRTRACSAPRSPSAAACARSRTCAACSTPAPTR